MKNATTIINIVILKIPENIFRSGLSKVWSVPDCTLLQVLKGHTCNVSSATFHPKAVIPGHFEKKVRLNIGTFLL